MAGTPFNPRIIETVSHLSKDSPSASPLSPISISVSLTEGKHVSLPLTFRLPCADPRDLDSVVGAAGLDIATDKDIAYP